MGAEDGVAANDSETGKEKNVASTSPARRHLDYEREQFRGHDTRPAARYPHKGHKTRELSGKYVP